MISLDDSVGRGRRHLAIEELETATDAGLLPQQIRGDDAAGRETAIAQHLRQEPLAGLHDEADIVPHAGFERQPSRQDGGVRGQRLRRVRVRALEHHAVGRERIDRRRLHVFVAVRRQVIGPQRVDRDQDDRPVDGSRGASETPAAESGQDRTERRKQKNDRESKGARHGICYVLWALALSARHPYFFNCSMVALACAASGEVGSTASTCDIALSAASLSPLFIASVPSL